jgi:predicted peptidase
MKEQQEASRTANLRYVLHVPDEPAPADGYPLLLFLHGKGERGDDLALVRKHGPPRLAAEGAREFPFVLLSPQCPVSTSWITRVADVAALVREIAERHAIDPSRIYGTGSSLGAAGIWALLEATPNLFTATVLVSPYGDAARVAGHAHVPTWIFYRDGDPYVEPPMTRELIRALVTAGASVSQADSVAAGRASASTVKVTCYPALAKSEPDAKRHDAWTATYAEAALYDWLCEHARQIT